MRCFSARNSSASCAFIEKNAIPLSIGHSGLVASPDRYIDEALAARDSDVFYWITVPNFNAHQPIQVKVRQPCLTDPSARAEVDRYFEGIGASTRAQEP